jgi:hypothetical protein
MLQQPGGQPVQRRSLLLSERRQHAPKIARLLRPGGRLIVNEHAWERLDEPTARRYLEQRAATDPDVPRSVEECLAERPVFATSGIRG